VIDTKVRDEIVDGGRLWSRSLWCWVPLVVEMVLSPEKVSLGIKHILILSKVWNGVVHWVIWLGDGWGPGQERLSLELLVGLEELELNLGRWKNILVIFVLLEYPIVRKSSLSCLLV
jgi:hypothetical protein